MRNKNVYFLSIGYIAIYAMTVKFVYPELDVTALATVKIRGQILTSDIKQSRSFSICNLTFLSSTINVFNLPTAFDIAE